MIADTPGRYRALVRTADGMTTRDVEIPDAESHVLEIVLGQARVTGVVVDDETGQPVRDARVQVVAPESAGKPGVRQYATAAAGSDGRFVVGAPAGRSRVGALARGYQAASEEVELAENGTADVRLALKRGGVVSGRVVDGGGNAVTGGMVTLRLREGGGMRMSRVDPGGSFSAEALPAGTWDVLAGSDSAGYGTAAGVTPGRQDVRIVVRPPSVLRLTLAPATAEASFELEIEGLRYVYPGWSARQSPGAYRLTLPPGDVVVHVHASGMKEVSLPLAVPALGQIARTLTLEPAPPPSEK